MSAVGDTPLVPLPIRSGTTGAALREIARFFWRAFELGLVYSSIWVAGSLASLCWFAGHVLGVPAVEPAILVFTSALFVYNLDHVADSHVQKVPDEEAVDYFRRPAVLLLMVASAVATGLLVSQAPRAAQWVFATYAPIALLYGLPLLPVRGSDGWRLARLKEIPFSKGWLVGTCITLGCVALPAAWSGTHHDFTTWQLALFVFVYASSNTHMFDVRDIENDREHKVLTLPVALGVPRTKLALILLNLVLLACMMWGWANALTGLHPEMIFGCIAAIAWIRLLDTHTHRTVYGTLIDGAWYLPALLVTVHHVGL